MAFKHYDVVRAAPPSDLAEKLTHKLKEGWQPFGSPVAITPYTLMERNIKVLLTEPQKAGIASFCPYNIGPGKCFPSTFYKRLNAGDRKGACEAIRWWIKDGGRDCRIRSNNCYGQVIRRDQESALACWGIEQ